MTIVRWRPVSQSVERWDPFREVGDLQSEMHRMFDGFFGRSLPGLDRVWAPAVDVFETKDDLVVTVELPGLSEKDIHLSITGDVLTIKGERGMASTSPENAYRSERWYGKFERSLSLPIPVQADKVKATYRDGVLTINLPKAEELKPKAIKIDVA
jgi:HSP20 family protein